MPETMPGAMSEVMPEAMPEEIRTTTPGALPTPGRQAAAAFEPGRHPRRRPAWKVHRRPALPEEDAPAAGPVPGPLHSPVHSIDALAASVAVASVAAGWMLATVVWTGPVLLAGNWLAQRIRMSEGA